MVRMEEMCLGSNITDSEHRQGPLMTELTSTGVRKCTGSYRIVVTLLQPPNMVSLFGDKMPPSLCNKEGSCFLSRGM